MTEEKIFVSPLQRYNGFLSSTLGIIIVLGLIILGVIIYLKFRKPPEEITSSPTSEISVSPKPKATPTPTPKPKAEATPSPTPSPDDINLIKQMVLTKIGPDKTQVIITVNQNTGQYAKGGVKEVEAESGGYYLAAKVQGSWVVVYDGQSHPTCDQLTPYNFPRDMVPECLDESGAVIKR